MIVESFNHIKESNTIEVVFREPSNIMYACNPPRPVPDKVWKEVYSVENGIIIKTQTINGKHEPGNFIPENITF